MPTGTWQKSININFDLCMAKKKKRKENMREKVTEKN